MFIMSLLFGNDTIFPLIFVYKYLHTQSTQKQIVEFDIKS